MTDDESPSPPPSDDTGSGATPPPPPPQRPLLRRDHDKHLAGVAGGIADHLGVDATIIRVAFVVLSIFGGGGVLLYLIAWAAMPSPSMPRSYVERWFGTAPNPATIVAIGVGVMVLLAIANDDRGFDGVGWALLLLFGGWLLFRADSRAGTTAPSPSGADQSAPPDPHGTWYGPGGIDGTAAAPTQPVWTPPEPRPRSILGRLTIGAALAALGVAALLEQVGILALEPAEYAALALTITGLGLVAGAWVGRAYGLIALGLVLTVVTVALSVGPVPIRGGVGEVSYTPQSIEDVDARYSLGAGELRLDLSDVQFAGTTTTTMVSVGVGETTIIVPDEVTVAVAATMRVGDVDLFGTRTLGRPFLQPITHVDEGPEGGGRLELVIDNGLGELTVERTTEEF